jgi:hypothetical protein
VYNAVVDSACSSPQQRVCAAAILCWAVVVAQYDLLPLTCRRDMLCEAVDGADCWGTVKLTIQALSLAITMMLLYLLCRLLLCLVHGVIVKGSFGGCNRAFGACSPSQQHVCVAAALCCAVLIATGAPQLVTCIMSCCT